MKFLQRYVRRPHGSFISELTVARILALENRLMVGCKMARWCWGRRGAKVLYHKERAGFSARYRPSSSPTSGRNETPHSRENPSAIRKCGPVPNPVSPPAKAGHDFDQPWQFERPGAPGDRHCGFSGSTCCEQNGQILRHGGRWFGVRPSGCTGQCRLKPELRACFNRV